MDITNRRKQAMSLEKHANILLNKENKLDRLLTDLNETTFLLIKFGYRRYEIKKLNGTFTLIVWATSLENIEEVHGKVAYKQTPVVQYDLTDQIIRDEKKGIENDRFFD